RRVRAPARQAVAGLPGGGRHAQARRPAPLVLVPAGAAPSGAGHLVSPRFTGKVVAVTGGASGIGEAMCQLVVAEGGAVVVIDRQTDRGKQLADRLGDQASFVAADVSSD